jgi:hypothetical protein
MAQQARRKDKTAEETQGPQASPASGPAAVLSSPGGWQKPQGLTRRGWAVLGAVVAVLNLPLLHYAVRGQAEAGVTLPYADSFSDPGTVERNYFNTGGHWRVLKGQLLSPGVRNNPLWLEAALPENVRVEFDVRSESPEGDIKVELFGDGTDHASGYVFIHGGWNNTLSIIARMDEHGRSLANLEADARRLAQERGLAQTDVVSTGVFKPGTRMRVEAHPFPVQIGRTYRWAIERRDGHLSWSIDGRPFMDFKDPFPLKGKGHDRFGFSSWDADLYFDNLQVTPL